MPEKRDGEDGSVAYILKGFPRLSETFIASEIYRLEQEGLRLRLFVIKPPDEDHRPEIVDLIRSKPAYLRPTTSLSGASLFEWLGRHLSDFLPGLLRVSLRHPFGVARAAAAALAQAVRARRAFWSWPRKTYLKEFLQATTIADGLSDAPDVRHLHAHFCHGAATITWMVAMITGLRFSFTAHAKDIYCESLNPAGLLRRKMNAALFVVTCTDANREHLERMSDTPVHCIYHGLNADFTRLLRERSGPPSRNGHMRLLSVGRLVAKKGFDIFIEACGILRQRGVPFETVIVGEDGDHSEEIKRRIVAHNLEQSVRLAGPMAQASLFDEYRRASMFCLPCRVLDNGDRDGIPNVLVEAMACGLPVVTTGISGIPEVVKDGINGLLVPTEDPEALADALIRIGQNRSLAYHLSCEAQSTVSERFDGERFAAQLAALFEEAMR
ncbi:MAG TPA: glycosyltransferase family 4 protein [Blastocatellia bacterium]|jgi:glycosyltransferase involved in cell wall biosynthesis|nr:glycosyltransferase family 4 protein [Blastocatellia bacterium]